MWIFCKLSSYLYVCFFISICPYVYMSIRRVDVQNRKLYTIVFRTLDDGETQISLLDFLENLEIFDSNFLLDLQERKMCGFFASFLHIYMSVFSYLYVPTSICLHACKFARKLYTIAFRTTARRRKREREREREMGGKRKNRKGRFIDPRSDDVEKKGKKRSSPNASLPPAAKRKKGLSDTVMKMKFMQKQSRTLKDIEERSKKREVERSIKWKAAEAVSKHQTAATSSREGGSLLICVPDDSVGCEADRISNFDGRRSFGHFNRNFEKGLTPREHDDEMDEDDGVDESEMVRRFGKYVKRHL